MNGTTPLINRQNVREYILKRAAARPGWDCKRVSGQALFEINAMLQDRLNKLVRAHPTVGKTFKEVL